MALRLCSAATIAATALLGLGAHVNAQSNRLEVMLLTSWEASLTRYDFSGSSYGVRFGTKDSVSKDQKWIVGADMIQSPDGFCVTANPGTNLEDDLMVFMLRCGDPGAPPGFQRWVLTPENTFQVTVSRDGRQRTYCLDADAGTASVIHGWECSAPWSPNKNQVWRIFYPGYPIHIGDKCIALSQDNSNGASIVATGCANAPLQMWKYDFAKGQLRLGDPSSRVCVDVPTVGESGEVHAWECSDANENQQLDFRMTDATVVGRVVGQFFVRGTDNCISLNSDTGQLVSKPCSSTTTVFSLETTLPGDTCGGTSCQNNGVCVFGRCRCPEIAFGGSCDDVGQRIRVRASNGLFLTVDKSNYGVEFGLLDGQKRQQLWIYYPKSGLVKVVGRRMCVRANGEAVTLEVCRPDDAQQQWSYDISTGKFKSRTGFGCLDINLKAGIVTTPARVTQCDSNPNANQIVDIVSPDLQTANSDMFASLIRHRTKANLCWTNANQKLTLAACDASSAQLWMFNDAYTGTGALCIGDTCVVAKVSNNQGAVTLARYDGQRIDQRFEYESTTGLIRMAKTQMCVAMAADASGLAMTTCNDKDTAQQWYLSKPDKCLSPEYVNMKDKCVKGKCTFGHCQCDPGFHGPACDVDTCTLLQCNNGGKCKLGQCECASGYAGAFCDDFVKCKGVKCLHGGKCTQDGSCDCPIGWSGQRCQDKHPNVLIRALTHQALGLEGGLVSTVVPDVRNKDHVWVYDAVKKMIRPSAMPDMCLQQTTENTLALSQCNTTLGTQKWNYDAAKGRLATSATPSSFVGFEQTITGRLLPRLGATFASTDGVDLAFVEIDRLDYPGTSLRSADRSKCLSAAASGGGVSGTTCAADDESQQWEYHPQNGVLRLPRIGAYVCLELSGPSGAAKAVPCDGQKAAQQFDYDVATKRFRNRQFSSCLTMDSATGFLGASTCSTDVKEQVLHFPFRGFCDVINMCEGGASCVFGRCACQGGREGAFCELTVDAATP